MPPNLTTEEPRGESDGAGFVSLAQASTTRRSLQKPFERFRARAILIAHRESPFAGAVHRHARVISRLVEDEEAHVEVRKTAIVQQTRLDGVVL